MISHFGRPKGARDPAFSLRQLVAPLSRAIGGREVFLRGLHRRRSEACRFHAAAGTGGPLENLRFHKEEEANSPDFARALAELGDIYVDDAFSAAHRAHASIDALARLHISASKAVRGNGQTATGACSASNSRGAVRTVARRDGRRCGQHVSEPRLRIDTVALAPPIDLHQRHQRGRSIM